MKRPTDSRRAVTLWREAIEANEAFLLAGLRRRLDINGDIQAERKRSYQKWAAEHDQTIRRMVERINQALKNDG